MKDKESDLYLRNHSKLADGTVTEEDVLVQFTDLSMSPPYWYSNAPTYLEWLQINMDAGRSDQLHAMFNLYSPTIVDSDIDPLVPVEHVYVEFEDWTIREYSRTDLVKWPKRGAATVSKYSVIFKNVWIRNIKYSGRPRQKLSGPRRHAQKDRRRPHLGSSRWGW